jgi:ankyrin repeat protein
MGFAKKLAKLGSDGDSFARVAPEVAQDTSTSKPNDGDELTPEEIAAKEHQRRVQEVQDIISLPDEEWARAALTMLSKNGLHRAGSLANARKRIRQSPQSENINSQVRFSTAEGLRTLLQSGGPGEGNQDGDAVPLDPNTVGAGKAVLFIAVDLKMIEHARVLLSCGADANMHSVYQNSNGEDLWQVPLHRAAAEWQQDMVALLIEHGADVNALSLIKGQTALHHAVTSAGYWILRRSWDDLEPVVRCLLSANSDVNIQDDHGHTPLADWIAIASIHKEKDFLPIAEMMIKAGADVNVPDENGYSPFMMSADLEGQSKLFRLLLEQGKPNMDQVNSEGDSALHLIAQRGDFDGVCLVMDAGADPNIPGARGETPLHRAAERRGYHEVVTRLLESADPTIQRADGRTAIELALLAGGIKETMRAFMQHAPSRSFVVAEHAKLKMVALVSGTSASRFDELVGSPGARGMVIDLPIIPGIKPLTESKATPEVPASGTTDDLETGAFTKAVQRFEELEGSSKNTEDAIFWPRRLIDIYSGAIVPADRTMQYVIVSYICSPEKISGPQNPEAYEDGREYWQRLCEASHLYPDLMELIRPVTEGVARLKFPSWEAFPTTLNPRYMTEVYWLVAREALHRGLQHVWIDGFCMSQNDKAERAEEIQLMADYYRNAECCVVVSESLRRGLRPAYDPSRQLFDGNPVQCSILAWAIGYHHARVWVLQETRLAREVVTRAGDVRIKTTELLRPEFPKDGSSSGNKLWLSIPKTKFDMNAPGDPRNQAETRIRKAIQNLPLSGSRIMGEPLSLDYCMILLRGRGSLFQHDKIFGILGLFPASVRRSLPVTYDLPLSTIFAIFTYLRVRSGDLTALLNVRAPDHPPHHIHAAPSWVPTGYGFNYSDILDLAPPNPSLNFRAEAGELHLRMPFLRIADAYSLTDPVFEEEPTSKHGNMILRFLDRHGTLLPQYRRAAVEPVDPDYNLTSDKNFTDGGYYVIRPPIIPTPLSPVDAAGREQRRLAIQVAAREDRAVVAMFGAEKTAGHAFLGALRTAWLVLCRVNENSSGDSRTGTARWRREGVMVLDRQSVEHMTGSADGPDEVQDFCIM